MNKYIEELNLKPDHDFLGSCSKLITVAICLLSTCNITLKNEFQFRNILRVIMFAITSLIQV